MTGWMKRYHESLKDMPAPIEAREIRQKLDTRGLIAYAKKQGKKLLTFLRMKKIRAYCDNGHLSK